MTSQASRRLILARFGLHRRQTVQLLMRRKMWIFGIVVLVANVVVAAFAPVIATHDPIYETHVADDLARPIWLTVLPGFEDLPRNLFMRIDSKDWSRELQGNRASLLKLDSAASDLAVYYERSGLEGNGETELMLTYDFGYPYAPPRTFVALLPIGITVTKLVGVTYRFAMSITRNSDAKTFVVYDSYPPWRSSDFSRLGDNRITIHSRDPTMARRLGVSLLERNLAEMIFSSKTDYTISLTISILDEGLKGDSGQVKITLSPVSFRIPGKAYGILGTNHEGADIFSQLVYGTRVSLIVGILSASIAVILGVIVGVIAGYKGGPVDQAFMFVSDTLIQTPTLPIIILVMLVFGRSIYMIISILALLSWMGLARQLRAWVLSLKERPFVEAVRAAGGSDLYIMFKVIAPQTVPLLTYSFVLSIPGAIMTEAGLSVLGFGDPLFPSWGKVLNEAYNFGGFASLAWWWIAPPMIALLLLALSIVFIGRTLEEVLNPRLRRR